MTHFGVTPRSTAFFADPRSPAARAVDRFRADNQQAVEKAWTNGFAEGQITGRREGYETGFNAGMEAGRKLFDIEVELLPRQTMPQLCAEVATRHGVTAAEIIGESRLRVICAARHEFCWRAHNELRMSYPQIGRFCSGRDHTTIMHGVRRHQKRLDEGTAL